MMVTRGARTPRMATRGGGRAEVGAARAGHLEVAHVRVQIGARWQARGLRQVCRARWRRPAAYDALRRGRAHHLQRERNERAKPPVAPRSARRAAPRTRRRRCRAQRLSSRGQLAVPRLLRPVLLRVSVHVHGPTRGPRDSRDSRLAKVRGTNSSLGGFVGGGHNHQEVVTTITKGRPSKYICTRNKQNLSNSAPLLSLEPSDRE